MTLLPATIARVAEHVPDRLAVVGDLDGAEMTYGELDHRAAQLAGLLTEHGVGPETVVGVAMHRGMALPVAVLAVLRAGGCYLPVDPDDPRLPEFLTEAGAALVLTQPGFAARVHGATDRPVLVLDDDLTALDGQPAGLAPVHPDQAAYVIFTSGSSGRPKGVVVPHGAIANQVAWTQDDHGLTAADRVLHQTAITFDVSVSELLWTLAAGATVVLAVPGGQKDADYLVDVMARRGITVAHLVPSMLAVLVDHEAFAGLPALRLVISGGEALDPALAERFFGCCPDVALANRYGPTEAAVDVLAWPCWPGGDVPIGLPGPGTTAFVLDEQLRPVPPGTPGELCVGGVQLARGYLGAPALTADRFVANPFAPGERLYRTGDLVRERPDGAFHYLGRIDQQVKLRGLRVEPAEVEAALLAHPDVGVAAVVPVRHAGDTRLAGYVVPRAGTAPTEAALRAHLAGRLPEHLVPAYLTTLDELPRMPGGKVDRAALATIPSGGAMSGGGGLRGLCAELLGAELGEHDDFFASGGHSLLATRLVGQARTRLGLRFTVADVFARRTVAGLLAVATRDGAPGAEPPVRVPRDRPLPLGLVQERVWFLQRLDPHSTAYQFQFAIRWRGDLDVPRLAGALATIVRRHEILRTTFAETGGEARQVVHEPFPVSLSVIESTPDTVWSEVDSFVRRPIDPRALPLVRWRLFRLGDGDHLLVQAEHHFVHDGWSLGVFLRELGQHYRGETLPELALQFADIAVWQREQHAAGRYATHVAYWVERLRGAPPLLELPQDRPRPARPTSAGDACVLPVDAALFRALRELAVRCGATPYMVMLAAFEVLLHRYSGATDLVVGTGVAGRTPETEPLLGMFVNTVALRLDAGGDPSFRTLLDRVRRVTEEAYAHQDAPFGDVVAALHQHRDLSVSPLTQVMFSFHDAAMPDLALPGVRGELVDLGNRTAKTDLNVIVVARPEQRVGQHDVAEQDASLWWEFSTDVYDRATVERMAGHYVGLLRAVVAAPDTAIGDLPVGAESPMTPVVANPGVPVTELVDGQAEARPDAVAVVGPAGETLTFAELAAAVARTAAGLRAAGVRADTPVALALRRSPDWIVALLAVLRAGGAFVPLDPAQPPARRARILADSGATIGITDDSPLGTDVRWFAPGELAGSEPLPEVTPDQLAYVLYTSGSTGEPRGVAVTHRGLANLVAWHRRAFGLGPGERASHLSGLGFDALVEEIFPALAAGAAVHLAPDAARATAPATRDWLCEQGITVAFAATPVAELLMELPWPPDCVLRHLLTGGDRLTRRPPPGLPFTVTNQYGPTENTVVATAGVVPPDGEGLPHIGTAIDGVGTRVLDARLRPVPAGVPGELCLTGQSLARGYHGRPDDTAFTVVDGERVYRTGDRVRQRPDGNLEFLGRLDDQLKVRGVRIEPAEVEAALSTHPAVRVAAVVPHPDRQRLVGYLVPTNGAVDTEALAAYLGERLPPVMVPTLWRELDRLPLTANGKLDRAALPAPAEEPAGATGPPDGPAEHRVAAVFRLVLGVPVNSRDDNFFALGGHSLNAMKVVHELGDEITIADVFTRPTVAALAAALAAPTGDPR